MSSDNVLPMSLEYFVTYVPERFRILFIITAGLARYSGRSTSA